MKGWLWAALAVGLGCGRSAAPEAVELRAGWVLDGIGSAEVPGHVVLELERAGRVPNAFLGTNEGAVQWVEDSVWTYRLELVRPEGWSAGDATFLVFDGLDTYATVEVDGAVVLEANNALRTWRSADFPAGDGEHELVVRFDPVAARGLEAAGGSAALPAGNEPRPIGKQSSPYTRKAPYQFGWDWGPRLAGPGITGMVRWVNPAAGGWTDAPTPWCEVLTASTASARVAVHGRSGWALEGDWNWDGDTLVLEQPALWWPRGMGDQPLYTLPWRHEATGVERTTRLGLRTLEWVQTPDAFGPPFALHVNGVPIHARGANIVPPDFHEVRAASRWIEPVEQAVSADMNMLRVWGGGIYPPESFYQACDEAGVLVWQDFAFACSMVPGDAAFLANLEAEAREQVARLRHHACLALWCGNNEVERAWYEWGWQDLYGLHGADSARVWADYEAVFNDLLPRVVAEESDAFYWPSSPNRGEGGDEHAWGIWFGLEDFDYYSRHRGRFASEYGLQSLPDRHTLREAGVEAFGDSALQYRQRSRMDWLEPGFDGWDMMLHFMGKAVGAPADGDLDDWIFRSQTTQALGLQHALERHRTSAGRYAGSLYWSLNDVWPAVSWSTVDWAGRWKLGHYAARRANAPRAVLWQRERTDSLVFIAFNDGPSRWRDTVHFELKTPDGQVRRRVQRAIDVAPHSQTAILLDALAPWSADPAHTYLGWTSSEGRRTALFVNPLDFRPPHAPVEVHGVPGGVEVTAPYYVPVVRLEADVPGWFEDNGFALEPGETRRVSFEIERGKPAEYTARSLKSVARCQAVN